MKRGETALLIWRLGEASRRPGHRILLAAFGLTACWAWLSAVTPGEALVGFAESARNLVWVGLLYSLSAASDERQRGVRLVYGAVAAVIGMQVIADSLAFFVPSSAILQTSLTLRITTAAGASQTRGAATRSTCAAGHPTLPSVHRSPPRAV